MNEKKKRILPKLFAALVVLTLISCCFLGTTFARYTSSSNGSASVDVATWDVDFTSSGSSNITFGTLSPKKAGYEEVSGETQVNSISSQNIVVITNSGDVSADVTITVEDITFTPVSGDSVTFGAGMSWNDETDTVDGTAPTKEQVEEVLKLAIIVTGATETDEGTGVYTANLAKNSASTTNITISASVDWTTAYADTMLNPEGSNGAVSDAIDTWIGQNIASVSISVTYTAVQASEVAGN